MMVEVSTWWALLGLISICALVGIGCGLLLKYFIDRSIEREDAADDLKALKRDVAVLEWELAELTEAHKSIAGEFRESLRMKKRKTKK